MNNLAEYKFLIANKPEFIVIDKGDYIVIDYVYTTSETFIGDAYLLNCRGIKFDKEGNIIALPLHKFFNVGEPQAAKINGYSIEQKLDGSMVHSVILNGEVRLMTRKGITDISIEAEKFLTNSQKDLIKTSSEFTFVFEFTSRYNRVVIDYPEAKLTLLAVRNIHSGMYEEVYNDAFSLTQRYSSDLDLNSIKDSSNIFGEGVVLVDGNGFNRVKIKTEEYVRRHSVVSNFNFMSIKKKLEIIFEGNIDDYVAFLSTDQFAEFQVLNDDVWNEFLDIERECNTIIRANQHLTQKEFAATIRNHKHSNVLFAMRNEKDYFPLIKKRVIENHSLIHGK